jgi:DNA methylase
MASGEMSSAEFMRFLADVFGHIARYSVSGAIVMAFMDWRHMSEMLEAGGTAFSELLNLCVWVKTNAGMGSLYRSQHELVFIFKSGKGRHINNIELGRHGRYRTNAWSYAGANTFGRNRDSDLEDHPTVKPLVMISDAIKDCSHRGGIVLDPFGGSGTTLLAAERTGRRARLIELDPRYVDVTLKRWARLRPDIVPILAETGETLEIVRQRRAEESAAAHKGNRLPPAGGQAA